MTDREIAANNDRIYIGAVRTVFMEQKPTQFVIRHRSSRLFWHGSATLGDIWGGVQLAKRYEFMTGALAAALFECREDAAVWDVVAVEGV